MTAGSAWPQADEDSLSDRADALMAVLRQVLSVSESWAHERTELFTPGTWSGASASAAAGTVTEVIGSLTDQQMSLATSIAWYRFASAVVTATKVAITETVEAAQAAIAAVEATAAIDPDAQSKIDTLVSDAHGINISIVADAAAAVSSSSFRPPTSEINQIITQAGLPGAPPLESSGTSGMLGGMKAFGPIKDSPAPDEKKIEQPPLGPAAPLTDPSATRWQGPPPPGANNQTGFWAVDMSRPMDSSKPVPAPAPYRSAPPPCSVLEGPTTGVIQTKAGKSPQSGDAVGADIQNVYKFRISGTEFTGQTQMVQIDGKWYQAQWQKCNYEMNKIPVVTGSGDLGSIQVPILTESKKWTPVTWSDIMQENAKYGGETFTIPNAFGIPIKVVNATPQVTTPNVPIMTNGG
jgi:hypothetical protein